MTALKKLGIHRKDAKGAKKFKIGLIILYKQACTSEKFYALP